MRLSHEVYRAIISGVEPYVQCCQADLLLFGSRANPSLRGGDIDLALVFAEEAECERASREAHRILGSIKMLLAEEEKIDLIVTTLKKSKSDPFLLRALAGAVLLKSW